MPVRLPSVDRALDVLEVLAASSEGLTVSEVSRTIRTPKSTTHYLIYTLLVRGYIQRNSDGRRYSLGLRSSELAQRGNTEQLRRVTRPDLRRVSERLGLTAIIGVLKGPQVVVIETADPSGKGIGGQWIGRHVDAHSSSIGKVLIAELSDLEIEALFRERPLARFTNKTVCCLQDLKAHLAKVRHNGFAVNDEEHIVGVRAVAAPIVNHVGRVIASIGVNGSHTEMPRSELLNVAKEVVAAAREVSRKLLDPIPLEV